MENEKKIEEKTEEKAEGKTAPKKSIVKQILLSLVILAAVMALTFSISTLKEVTVEGNLIYDQSEVVNAVINDEYCWNTLYVFLKYRFREADEMPFVDHMDVQLTGLHSVNIRVTVKDMYGYVFDSARNRNVYFDENGIVTDISDKTVEGVPRVTGEACEASKIGAVVPIRQVILKEELAVMKSLKREDLIPEEIRFGDIYSPILYYGDVTVNLGETNNLLEKKLERLIAIYPDIKELKGVLHLEAWTESATSIIFTQDKKSMEADTESEDSETQEEASTEGEGAGINNEAPKYEGDDDDGV